MDDFILVVDDNLENLKVLGNILRENGYKFALVQSGVEAFAILENMVPLVIFLDVMMPDMDGYEVLRQLKKSAILSDIPVIMVTAKTDAEDVDMALNLGAIDFIKKPVNKVELLARLRTAVRLREKETSLKNMIQSKDQFIQMVAHDLRSSFASISGFADILIKDNELQYQLKAEQREYLGLILDTSIYLVDYFNKLLDWASIENNPLQIHKENINLWSIVQTSHALYFNKISDKKQTFFNLCANDVIIQADGSLFIQIINNLLSNAIKFTPEKGEISIFTQKNKDEIQLVIRDSGKGITGISRDELFLKSFHKSTRGTLGEKGTGVGLHICKIISDAHAFKLTFQPAPERGTDFIIIIPVK